MGKARHQRTRGVASGIAMAVFVTAPAWAQQSNNASESRDQRETQILQQVEVGADSYAPVGPDFGYVGQRSLTATKTDTPVSETPRSVSIVTREQMDDRAAVSISDALRYTPGLQSGFFGEDNKQDWFIIRGFKQANNGLYRDGTRVYSSGFYSWQIDPFTLERVEILRGPASVLYGQTPPGGVINVVSKRPQYYDHGAIEVEYGTWDNRTVSMDVGGPVGQGNNKAYRVLAMAGKNGTQVDDVEAERQLVAPSFNIKIGDATDLTLLSSFQKDDSDPYLQFLPAEGTLTPNPNGKIRSDVAVGNPDYEYFKRTQYTLGYQLKHALNERTEFQQSVRYGHIDIDLKQMYFSGYAQDAPAVGAALDPSGARRDILRGVSTEDGDADQWTADNRLVHSWNYNGVDHTLLLGLDYQSLAIRGKDYPQDPIAADGNGSVLGLPYDPRFDIYNPSYSNDVVLLNPGTLTPYTDADLQTRTTDAYQLGGYLQDQMKFGDHWTFLFGARYDHAKTETKNKATGKQQDVRDKEWTVNTGLAYVADNGVTTYTSYSQSFQPIIQLDSNGEPFKPEYGDQVEVGVKIQPRGVDGYLNLAVFNIDQENLTKFVNGNTSQIGKVRSKGVEVEGVANITPAFSVIATGTLMDVAIKEGPEAEKGETPSQVADKLASLWGNYKFLGGMLDGLSVGAGARYTGETHGDNTGTLRVPSYTLYDATVSYAWDNWKFQVAGKNLADKDYIATCDYYCWYGNGRNVIGSVSYTW